MTIERSPTNYPARTGPDGRYRFDALYPGNSVRIMARLPDKFDAVPQDVRTPKGRAAMLQHDAEGMLSVTGDVRVLAGQTVTAPPIRLLPEIHSRKS